jgi:alkylation response protein AidB-like acyl-CoA dehydrogenase
VIDLAAEIVSRTKELASLSDPSDQGSLLALLRLLYRTGRDDLPLGRLFEGHVDAMQIVMRYGTDAQRQALGDAVGAGAVLGVWNADLAGEPLELGGSRLSGGKSFASGAGILSHALVTVDTEMGRQLILLDLCRTPPAIDTGFWRVVGMQRSATHVVRWKDAEIEQRDLIGLPGDYIREPWFSGGALRFAAVQAGGVAAHAITSSTPVALQTRIRRGGSRPSTASPKRRQAPCARLPRSGSIRSRRVRRWSRLLAPRCTKPVVVRSEWPRKPLAHSRSSLIIRLQRRSPICPCT